MNPDTLLEVLGLQDPSVKVMIKMWADTLEKGGDRNPPVVDDPIPLPAKVINASSKNDKFENMCAEDLPSAVEKAWENPISNVYYRVMIDLNRFEGDKDEK